jgi:hypothetical protein
VPLGLIWEGSAVAQKIYSFAIDTHLRVPLGRQLRVYVGTDNGPAAFGDCTAIGNRLTNS